MTDICTGLRVELARSRARRDRWLEEVILTSEEMRRNMAFGRWQRQQWRNLASSAPTQPTEDPVLREGLSSYAFERADYEADLLKALELKWTPIVRKWSSSPYLHGKLIEPFDAGTVLGTATAASSHSTTPTADAATLLLNIQASTGLALSTNNLEYEPTWVI
jgi:hypothetical protein